MFLLLLFVCLFLFICSCGLGGFNYRSMTRQLLNATSEKTLHEDIREDHNLLHVGMWLNQSLRDKARQTMFCY